MEESRSKSSSSDIFEDEGQGCDGEGDCDLDFIPAFSWGEVTPSQSE